MCPCRLRYALWMDTDMAAAGERLVALESRLALAEDLLDELNRTVFRQQERIDAMLRELMQLRLQQALAGETLPAPAAGERPPHY